MAKKVRVVAKWRKEPDIGLYVLALIELVRQLEAQEAPETSASKPVTPENGEEHGRD